MLSGLCVFNRDNYVYEFRCVATGAATPAIDPTSTGGGSAPPVLSPIHADFSQATFTTTYTVTAPGVDGATYRWSVSIPPDPPCAGGFRGNSPAAHQAAWFHKDAAEGGICNHGGSLDGPRGHPGTVTVTVSNATWNCTATYTGTITGDGDRTAPCTRR